MMDDNKRKRILFKAMELFNKRGFHNTPTSLIAKEAKVSVGSLFNYFPTKATLIHSIYVEIKNHSKFTFLELIEERDTHKHNLLSMYNAVIKWGVDNPDEFTYIEAFIHSPFYKAFKRDKVMITYDKFRKTLFKAISPNTICMEYPEYSTYYMDQAIHAAIKFILENKIEEESQEHFIHSSFNMLWYGFSREQ